MLSHSTKIITLVGVIFIVSGASAQWAEFPSDPNAANVLAYADFDDGTGQDVTAVRGSLLVVTDEAMTPWTSGLDGLLWLDNSRDYQINLDVADFEIFYTLTSISFANHDARTPTVAMRDNPAVVLTEPSFQSIGFNHGGTVGSSLGDNSDLSWAITGEQSFNLNPYETGWATPGINTVKVHVIINGTNMIIRKQHVGFEPDMVTLTLDDDLTNGGDTTPRTSGKFMFFSQDSGLALIDDVAVITITSVPVATCGDPNNPVPLADFWPDCVVNIIDYALFSENWMEDNRP